jgi:hypothetical protein
MKVGLVNIFSERSEYVWDGEARSRSPRSSQRISVYRRLRS